MSEQTKKPGNKKKVLGVLAGAAGLLLVVGGGIFLGSQLAEGSAGRAGTASEEEQDGFSGEITPEKRQNMLTLAEDYKERGEYQRALDLLDQLMLEDPSDEEASSLRDQIIEAKKRAEEAEARARQEEMEALKRQQEQLESLGASISEQTSRMESTEERKAREERERRVNQLLNQAEDALYEEDYNTARSLINEALEEDPSSERAYDLKDELRQKEKEAEEARRKAESEAERKAREEQEQRAAELIEEGEEALEREDFPEARAKGDEALEVLEGSGEAWNLKGKAWYEQNPDGSVNREKAREAFSKALDGNPELWEPYYYLGLMDAEQGRGNEAIRNLTEASRQNPNRAEVFYKLGVSQYKAGMYPRALDSFMMAEQLEPSMAEVYYPLGLSYRKNGKPDKALEAFESSMEKRPDHDTSFYEAARIYRDREEYGKAVQALESAAEADPDDARNWRTLGNVYYLTGAYSESETAYQKALEREERASSYYNLAMAQKKQEKFSDALQNASQAVKIENGNPKYLFALGDIAQAQGMTDNAEAMYQKAIQADASYVPPRVNLGGIYDEQEEYEKALEVLKPAHSVDPDSLEVNNNLGNVYLHKDSYEESIQYFRKAVDASPEDPKIRFNLGVAYIETERFDQAEEALKKVIQTDGEYWDAYYRLGQLLYRQDKAEAGKAVFRELLNKNPDYEKKSEVMGYLE